ncbi:MAG: hybrid sensor histidine kinase/response regulator [Drouetiella hepatica Uher 2000/2452]|jgi:signal transduction histidine kinase|uniref:histidine kinase n=1 Tax=Drouetiella hepatica Uher 2000/2452 TaxID=904376 RepID=A0A951QGA0_9CYAN|nr:hybrid sensor histidine kinase/response regulator [Drouetiella hepatica Uher 2000/2452]
MDEILKILIVDDDEVDRMALRRLLKAAGVAIKAVETVDCGEAIAILKEQIFDCAFIDYRLPDMTGLELVQVLRGDSIRIPLIILTGQGDEQIAVELMKAGASDYIAKGRLSPEALAQVLRNAVRIHQAEMQAALAEQQKEQLARQREDFVSRLTHDLRTPLVAADRTLNLFQEGAFGDISPDMQDMLTVMIRSNQNLLHMVNTILEVYRHDAGRKTMSFESCKLYPLVKEVVQELAPLAQERGLKIAIDAAIDTTIAADCMEIRRLLTNLIGNAIKFTDRGSITIRLDKATQSTAQPGLVAIEVEDTGSGISPEDQATLFDRFRQGNHKRSGSGLGMYLSRRIVEAHNGTIAVKSALGQGSLFIVQLPIVQNAE